MADNKHQIALSHELIKPLGVRPLAEVAVEPNVTLKAVSANSKKWTPEQRLAFAKAFATAGTATLPIIKTYYPTATPAIEGVELVFATTHAIHAWLDPKRTNVVKPIIKTSRALVELFDLLKIATPALGQFVPQVQVIGVIVKVGDALYQSYTDVKDIVKAEQIK